MNITKEFDEFKLILDDEGSGNEKMLLRLEDPVEDYLISGYDLDPTGTVIDIGAHIGRFSVYAGFKAKSVFSFEPDSRNISKLKENIKLNELKNIFVFEKAVNGTGDDAQFRFSENPSENSLFEKNLDLPTATVKGITLKEIIDDNKIDKCDFLKLDCEGAEYEILDSLPTEYFEKIDKIVLEYHDHLHEGKSLKDLVLVLTKNYFKVTKVMRGAWYTGLLYAKKTNHKPFLHNFFRVYVVDLISFLISLIKKKFF